MSATRKTPALNFGDLVDAHLECVLTAANEADVKLCMELTGAAMDKSEEDGREEDKASFGACIAAASNGEDIDECVLLSDMHDEHCYG